MTDITILTCKPYYQPKEVTPYIQNILDEYNHLKEALVELGLKVERTYWDDPTYDWSQTKAVVFRTIWDYFERFDEFWPWLEELKDTTILINPFNLIEWNIDKHYLQDLEQKGIRIVPTYFVNKGQWQSLDEICTLMDWKDVVIKPAISGAAFHTHKIVHSEIIKSEALFKQLVEDRDMLVQPYQKTITVMGEASLMVFNGTFTHAILKRAKPGDFRVQDDFGGTVHPYTASNDEIAFAEKVFAACNPVPAYGRADIIWDEQGTIYLSELEIVEPELWVRNHPEAAKPFAKGILRFLREA